MTEYKVAYGESRKAKNWKNSSITWDKLGEQLKHPLRTAKTQAEYARMKSAGKSLSKDKGSFVARELKGGLRRASIVMCRSMLTMDLDNASTSFIDEYKALSPYKTFIYSTHSHRSDAPRLRMIISLTSDISPDEYQAVKRFFASEQEINQFDACSFIPSQLIFWPTVSSDGEYVFEEVEGSQLDPDASLIQYPNWKDPASLPTEFRERPLHERTGQKAEDPLEKEGIVGTFCRAMGSIENVIDKYLSDVYEAAGSNHYQGRE